MTMMMMLTVLIIPNAAIALSLVMATESSVPEKQSRISVSDSVGNIVTQPRVAKPMAMAEARVVMNGVFRFDHFCLCMPAAPAFEHFNFDSVGFAADLVNMLLLFIAHCRRSLAVSPQGEQGTGDDDNERKQSRSRLVCLCAFEVGNLVTQ